jgi:hypothetical protein
MENKDEREELKQMAPTLFGLKKKELFEAPEGYLESFPEQLQMAIQNREKKTNLVLGFFMKWKYALSIACIALVVGFFTLRYQTETATTVKSAQFSEKITEDELLDTFNEEELTAMLIETDEKSVENESTEMEDYLLENYTEEELLTE